MALVTEVYTDNGWQPVARVGIGDPPGSLSDNTGGRRDVYTFTCLGDHSIVKRSRFGLDEEVGAGRNITPLAGWEHIATLRQGESKELTIQPGRLPHPVRVRLKHVSD